MSTTQSDWLIIDGYSLIHRDPELKRLFPDQLLFARQRLIRLIEQASAKLPKRITVVFDGKGERTERDMEMDTCVEVLFSPAHMTADSVIERMVYSDPLPARILVVSSDRLERDTVSAAGAQTISCGDFLRLCQPPPARPRGLHKKKDATLGDYFPT